MRNEKGLSQIIIFIFLLPALIMLLLMLIGIGDFYFKKYALSNINDTALDTIVKHGAKKGASDSINFVLNKLSEEAKNIDLGGFKINIYAKINNGSLEKYDVDTFLNLIDLYGLGRNNNRQDFVGIELVSNNSSFLNKIIKYSPLGWFAYDGTNELKYQHYIGDEIEQWIED